MDVATLSIIASVLGVGVALAVVLLRAIARLDRHIDRAEDARRADMRALIARMDRAEEARQSDVRDLVAGQAELREHLAKLEGLRETMHAMGAEGNPSFDRMHGMAEARGIPVIDQYGYIVRQGGRIKDAVRTHDNHWNVAGRRWAAGALLEWIERNRAVRPPGGAPHAVLHAWTTMSERRKLPVIS